MKLAIKSIPLANVNLFLGTSFKRIKSQVPLDTVFRSSARVKKLDAIEIGQFLQFYEDFKVREKIKKTVNPPLNKKDLLKQIQNGDSEVFVIKDADNLIKGGLVVSLLRLPRNLNEQYFGADFERFAYVHKLCYQKNCDAMIPEMIAHVALAVQQQGLRAVMAHVWPQHRDLCDRVLQKPFFKRVSGENYTSEDTLICLDLE